MRREAPSGSSCCWTATHLVLQSRSRSRRLPYSRARGNLRGTATLATSCSVYRFAKYASSRASGPTTTCAGSEHPFRVGIVCATPLPIPTRIPSQAGQASHGAQESVCRVLTSAGPRLRTGSTACASATERPPAPSELQPRVNLETISSKTLSASALTSSRVSGWMGCWTMMVL